MRISRRILPALAVALFLFLMLASSALAGTPSTVTVRVVGLTGTTLLPQTQVTTNATPIDPDGKPSDTCSGTSAFGALYDAVHGNWVVLYESPELGYQIDGILGLNFPPFSANPDAYWSFWMNNAYEEIGACGQELNSGDNIVFFAQCDELGTDCPSSKTEPEHFLTEAMPATAQVGTHVTVNVGSLSTSSGKPEASIPGGITVSAGSVSALVNAEGEATLDFPSTGTYTIQASAPNSVPSEPHTICVHNGNDGTCGTTLPIACATSAGAACPPLERTLTPPPPPSLAATARITGVKSGHVYSRRSAPRLLAGVVEVPSGGTLRQVRISLQRRYHGRCFDFNGARESFVRTKKCGSADFFSVGGSESFSYLLPARLPKGSYTYDIEAINSAGQATKLVSGISHVVFQVK